MTDYVLGYDLREGWNRCEARRHRRAVAYLANSCSKKKTNTDAQEWMLQAMAVDSMGTAGVPPASSKNLLNEQTRAIPIDASKTLEHPIISRPHRALYAVRAQLRLPRKRQAS